MPVSTIMGCRKQCPGTCPWANRAPGAAERRDLESESTMVRLRRALAWERARICFRHGREAESIFKSTENHEIRKIKVSYFRETIFRKLHTVWWFRNKRCLRDIHRNREEAEGKSVSAILETLNSFFWELEAFEWSILLCISEFFL